MSRQRIKVVIVDDNDMMRTILRGILRGEEYNVVGEARNGVLGVEMVARMQPDIVCMDVQMPEMDGLEAMIQIKADRPETEIVMVTGSADPGTVSDAIQNGAAGFIIKPFNVARVLDTLDRVSVRVLRQRKKGS